MGNNISRAKITKESSFSYGTLYKIDYKDSKGKQRSYKTFNDAALATQLINNYFHANNSTITFKQAQSLKQDICTKFSPKKGGRVQTTEWYTLLRDAINDFTLKGSDGDENITPNEVYQIYERIEAGADHI